MKDDITPVLRAATNALVGAGTRAELAIRLRGTALSEDDLAARASMREAITLAERALATLKDLPWLNGELAARAAV